MTWQTILAALWTVLNSPAGITALAGLILWALNRLYSARPEWQQYEGTIIAAIKFAEKTIPDDVPNKDLERLDTALKYVLGVYEQARGRRATPQVEANLKEGIQIVHSRLEANGNL
jgi:low affinity Fe/Cu permease